MSIDLILEPFRFMVRAFVGTGLVARCRYGGYLVAQGNHDAIAHTSFTGIAWLDLGIRSMWVPAFYSDCRRGIFNRVSKVNNTLPCHFVHRGPAWGLCYSRHT